MVAGGAFDKAKGDDALWRQLSRLLLSFVRLFWKSLLQPLLRPEMVLGRVLKIRNYDSKFIQADAGTQETTVLTYSW